MSAAPFCHASPLAQDDSDYAAASSGSATAPARSLTQLREQGAGAELRKEGKGKDAELRRSEDPCKGVAPELYEQCREKVGGKDKEQEKDKDKEKEKLARGEEPEKLSPLELALGGDALVKGAARERELERERQAKDGTVSLSEAPAQAFSVTAIRQFGYDYFRPDAKGFASLVDVPVAPDYLVGAGDRLVVTIWGSTEGSYELEVSRSGEIILPMVGPVKVAGVTFAQLPEVVRGRLSRELRNFQVSVSMGKLRMVKVYIVGQVHAPGDYNVSSLATLLNALSAAGGPTKQGTLRNVQIKRGGKLVETVDLYDFFLKGDKSRDIRLQAGDTVYVPPIGPVAGVAGNVRVPAIFELREEKTLKDLLALAGGVKPTGDLQRVQLSRVQAHQSFNVTDVNLGPNGKSPTDLEKTILIRDMDVVKIFPIDTTMRGYVRLKGHVRRTGDVALKPGLRLGQLLREAELLPEHDDATGEIIRLYPPDLHPEKITFNPGRALAGEPQYDLELKEFDTVRVFGRWEMEQMPTVRVSGEVQRPGEYRLYSNMTVRDLLTSAGNPKLTAYLKSAELSRVKRSGESVSSYSQNIDLGKALAADPKENVTLAPFDELIVRKIPQWAEETDRNIILKGEFRFPGVYPVRKGERLSSVIERAGGFTDKAYLKAAKFCRVSVREQQQKRMDEMITKAELEITKKQSELASVASSKEELESTKSALEGLDRSVQLLKAAKAEGRMVLTLTEPAQLKHSSMDVELQGGDVLEVPERPAAIHVMGQVYNPTSVIPTGKQDVDYYLKKAGGPTRDAQTSDIYLVRTDGTVVSRQQVSAWRSLFFSGFFSTEVEPGDTVVVPQRFEKVAWMRDLKDIASILGNLALTAGVVLAAGL